MGCKERRSVYSSSKWNVSYVVGGTDYASLVGSWNTIEMSEDGNIIASYVDKPTLQGTDKLMNWAMAGLMGGMFPEKSEITSLAATSGFVNSPAGLATWSESNGKVVVKLNITNIFGCCSWRSGCKQFGNHHQSGTDRRTCCVERIIEKFVSD